MKFSSYILQAVKSLPARGRRNGIKILTLGLGLAVGVQLLTKVCFERTYDDCFRDSDRLCYVSEVIVQSGQEMAWAQTSGGIAPRLKEHFPQVEEATRWTYLETDAKLAFTGDRQKTGSDAVILADSCFFNVFDRPCVAGSLSDAVSVRGNAAISESMARKIAGSGASDPSSEVLGRRFTIDGYDKAEATIAAVYEDFPFSSSCRPDVVVALRGIGDYTFDGSDRLVGNDRYKTILRLSKGASADDLNAGMDGFVQSYLPVEDLKAMGVEFSYTARPYSDYHFEDNDIRSTLLILTIVALALLLTSVLNYLLIVISTSVVRGREMAMRKCLGSGSGEMYRMMAAESLVHTVLSCILAAVLIFVMSKVAPDLVSASELPAMYSGRPLAVALAVVALVFAVNTVVPAAMYNRIPVASAFRNYRASKRAWKLGLLAVEFGAVAFLGVLVSIISLQYRKLTNADLGFDCSSTAIVDIQSLGSSQKKAAISEIRSLHGVEDATLCYGGPFQGYSGNNVMLPGSPDVLFNCSDAYWNDVHWLDVMGIRLVKGRNFTEGRMYDDEVIIDSDFEEMLKRITGWDDVLGKDICLSEHSGGKDQGGVSTIVGVFKPIYHGFTAKSEAGGVRPMAAFYVNPDYSCTTYQSIIVKYNGISQEALAETKAALDRVAPDKELQVVPLRDENLAQFRDTKDVRNAILAGGIVTLLIALIGLIGYTVDEVKRRSKEIAVRRINGAQFSGIRRMFVGDLMKIAVPSAALGCILAGIAASRWERQFTLQAGLPWWVFALTFTLTLVIVAALSDSYVRKVAESNPAESIKTE